MKKHHPNSHKGALIKGMSKVLPSDILTNPAFKKSLRKIMRGYAGIYALYKGERLYYVGLAGNLDGRIRWHLKDRHSGKWDHFRIFRIQRVRYLKDIETLILSITTCRGNRAHGHLPKDADLNKILRSTLSDYSRQIKTLKRAIY